MFWKDLSWLTHVHGSKTTNNSDYITQAMNYLFLFVYM